MSAVEVQLPEKLRSLFAIPRGKVRYRGAYGGRGSAKSRSFAKMAAVFGYVEPLRILCCRELLKSIKDSMHAEIAAAIASEPWLAHHYKVGESYIRGRNGTVFIFAGLHGNIDAIKSMAQIDICIIEEAEAVSEDSYVKLIPTIRSEKSEIWPIWNREDEGSPTDMRFIKQPPDTAVIVEVNWRDNPWFPDVLNGERLHDLKYKSLEDYNHIWEGTYALRSASHIFGMFEVPPMDSKGNFVGETKHVKPHTFLVDEVRRNRDWYDLFWMNDPGSASVFASMFVAIHRTTKRFIVLNEIYETEHLKTSTKQIIPRALEKIAEITPGQVEDYWSMKRNGNVVAPLPSWFAGYDNAASWFHSEAVNEFQIGLIPCDKASTNKEDGLSAIKDFMIADLFWVSDRCPRTIGEIKNYKTDEKGRIPKGNDHEIDNTRYIFTAAGLNTISKTLLIKSPDDRENHAIKDHQHVEDLENDVILSIESEFE